MDSTVPLLRSVSTAWDPSSPPLLPQPGPQLPVTFHMLLTETSASLLLPLPSSPPSFHPLRLLFLKMPPGSRHASHWYYYGFA